MKQKILLIYCLFLLSLSSLFAQTDLLSVELSYSANQKKISYILKDLEGLTNSHFTYNSTLFDDNKETSISVTQTELKGVLNILFSHSFAYKQIGSQILISQKKGIVIPQEKIKNKPKKKISKRQIKSPSQVYDTICVHDTIQHILYDTLKLTVYDTIRIIDSTDFKEAARIAQRKENTSLTFGGFGGSHISYPLFYNSESPHYTENLKQAEKNTIGTSKTIMLSYQKKKFSYGVGVQFVNYNQKTDYTTSLFVDDGSTTYKDSLWRWEYNLLFEYYKFIPGGDSVVIPVYDSVYTYSIVENPKKVEKYTKIQSENKYKYIGIPLSIGLRYHFNYKFEVQSTLHLTPLFLVYRSGSLPNQDITQAIDLEDIALSPVIFSIGFSWNFMYHMNKYYSIHCKPSCYSIPRFAQSKETGFQKANLALSLEFGISYTIPYELF